MIEKSPIPYNDYTGKPNASDVEARDYYHQYYIEQFVLELDLIFRLAPDDSVYFRLLVADLLDYLKTGKPAKQRADDQYQAFLKETGGKR